MSAVFKNVEFHFKFYVLFFLFVMTAHVALALSCSDGGFFDGRWLIVHPMQIRCVTAN